MKTFTQDTNASWLYEKAYFFGLNWEDEDPYNGNQSDLEKKNNALYQLRFSPPAKQGDQPLLILKTTYPGMLSGSGYPHEMGFKGELKLGFSFDYTTGLPYLPGSSLKGLLRSPFRSKEGKKYVEVLLKDLLGSLPSPKHTSESLDLLGQLEKEIFEGHRLVRGKDGNTQNEPFPISQRDIFHDSFVQSSSHQSHQKEFKGGFLGPDFITPHINRDNEDLSPFTDPIPLAFLKVLPGVIFGFDFRLHDSQVLPSLTAEKKYQLFKQILLDFGIGAKTNVGYGQLEDPDSPRAHVQMEKKASSPSKASPQAPAPPSSQSPVENPAADPVAKPSLEYLPKDRVRRNRKVQAEVIEHQSRKLILRLGIEEYEEKVSVRAAPQLFPVGCIVEILINDVSGRGKNMRISVGIPNPKDILYKPE